MHVDMTKKTNFAIENTSKRRIFGAIMEFRFCIKPTGKHEQALLERTQIDDIQKKIYLK